MKIRFLQTTPSENPDLPFQAGQIIDVAHPTAAMLRCLEPAADGTQHAEVLRDDAGELATVGTSEQAVKPRGKGHRA